MAIAVATTRQALADAYKTLGTWIGTATGNPGTTATPASESAGGSPGYARKQTTWSSSTGGVINGTSVTVDVPASATRFEQVKVGDSVTISYYDRVIIRLKPAGEAAVDRTTTPTATPAAGSNPGGTLASQRIATVTLTGWDPANRVVSFNGPNGVSYTRGLMDSTDPAILSGLKVGERVDVTWTVATRFSVTPK